MNTLTKKQALDAMKAEQPQEVKIAFRNFSITCNVSLSLSAQLSLVEQTLRNCAEVQEVNTGRSPLLRRAMFESLYLWTYTNVSEILGIGEENNELTQEHLTRLCNKLNIVETLSDMDTRYKRMFDDMMATLEWRSTFEERLLATNLATQKLNTFLDSVSSVFDNLEVLESALAKVEEQQAKEQQATKQV